MEHIKIESREKSWPRFHAFMTAALLAFFMLSPAAPEHWSALYSVYGRCAIIVMLALYFWKCGLRGAVEVKLVIWYAIWLFITRLLNTDYYLENEFDLVLKTFLCAAVLAAGLVLDSTQRRRFFDIAKAYEVFSPGAAWNGSNYTNAETGVKAENTFLVYQDTYIMGNPGHYMGSTSVEVPEKYFTIK